MANHRATWLYVDQTSHGFSVGDLIYFSSPGWSKAKADAHGTCAVGVVNQVDDVDSFCVTFGGIVILSGLTAGLPYYLSASAAGAVSQSPPTTAGQFVQRVYFSLSTTEAVVTCGTPAKVAAAGGGSFDPKPYCVLDSTASQTMSTTAITVNLDSAVITDAEYTLSSDTVEVATGGTYWVTGWCTFDANANVTTARDGCFVWIERDQGTGTWVTVNQLQGSEYWREQSGENTPRCVGPVELAAGEAIRLRFQQEAGTATAFPLEANKSGIAIWHMK